MKSALILNVLMAMASCLSAKYFEKASNNGLNIPVKSSSIQTFTENDDAYYKICIDGKFDAISYMDDGTYFAFRNEYCIEISPNGLINNNRKVMLISDQFPNIPNNIDDVVTWPATARTKARTYFFKGSQYWTRKDGKITGPRSIECGFHGVPANVDAVFMEGSDTIFVKGNLFYRYILGYESLSPVKKSATKRWRYIPNGISTAYYNYHLKKTFYFVNKKYMILNRFDKQIANGYPKFIIQQILKCRIEI